MGGKSGGGGTTVQQSEPWSEQKPYLTYGFGEAQSQYKSGQPAYYPHQTVAPFSSVTQEALNAQRARALGGSPLQNQANIEAGRTLSGGYLNSNPYLDANFQAGARQISNAFRDTTSGNQSAFSRAGRYGSGLQAYVDRRSEDTLAQNLGELASKTYGENYQQERANQLRALAFAPQLINQDYQDLRMLGNVGAAYDQQQQNLIDADIARWNYNQNLPANKLNQYLGQISGSYGGTSSTSTPSNRNALASGLLGAGSGALTGFAVGGPVGAAIGGGLGLLGGGLF